MTLSMSLGNQENALISSAVPKVRVLLMKKRPTIHVTRPTISSRIGTPMTPPMVIDMFMNGFALSAISCVNCGFVFICSAIAFWNCASKMGCSTFLLAKKSAIMTTHTTRYGTMGLAVARLANTFAGDAKMSTKSSAMLVLSMGGGTAGGGAVISSSSGLGWGCATLTLSHRSLAAQARAGVRETSEAAFEYVNQTHRITGTAIGGTSVSTVPR